MAIVFRNSGDAVHSPLPLNPSFPSGGQSQDLNILSIAALGTAAFGTFKRPVTPSGWTLRTSPFGDNWNTAQHVSSNVVYYVYTKVGAFTGPLGNITWTGSGSEPTWAIAAIDIFGCGASETWDASLYGTGVDFATGSAIDWNFKTVADRHGVSNRGRIDPAAGDHFFIAAVMNAENSGYPIAQWLSGGNIISNTGIYNPGSGVTGTYTNLDNDWTGAGTGNQNDGVTLIRSRYSVTTAKPPYGSPQFTTPLYNPSNGFCVNLRLTITQKSSSDARTITDGTKTFGLTSGDTGAVTEGTLNNGALNVNPHFNNGVANWTAQNGATIIQSYAKFINGDSSMLITPDGATSTPQVISEELTIIPNNIYLAHSWMEGNGQAIKQGIFWYNASHTFMSSNLSDDNGSVDGEWKEYTLRAQAPPGARYARMAINGPGVLSVGQAWHVDDAYLADGSVRFPRVPYPRRWKNGDIPTATALNKNWRDAFLWLTGDRPAFVGTSTDATNWTVGQWDPLPINTVSLKQYFLHTIGDTKIYVTEDGWYNTIAMTSREPNGAAGSSVDITGVRRNGDNNLVLLMGHHQGHILGTSFKVNTADQTSIYLSAGDYIELCVWSTAGAGTVKSWISSVETNPRIEIWWAER